MAKVIAGRLVPLPVGTVVRKSSPYYRLRDLKGKKYTVGVTAHKTVLFILNAFLWNAGMTEEDVEGEPVIGREIVATRTPKMSTLSSSG